jgi:hypothetical protein
VRADAVPLRPASAQGWQSWLAAVLSDELPRAWQATESARDHQPGLLHIVSSC